MRVCLGLSFERWAARARSAAWFCSGDQLSPLVAWAEMMANSAGQADTLGLGGEPAALVVAQAQGASAELLL